MLNFLSLRAMVPRQKAGSDDCINNAVAPDYLFRCSYCIKLIAEDSPVFMRQDNSYCSLACRDKGLSRLFTQLKESQLEEAGKLFSSCSLTERVHSDSSIASKTTHRTVNDAGTEGKTSLFARLGQAVLDVVLQRVASKAWGEKALRTYSSGMMWGRQNSFIKNSTSAQRLFEYLPEVDHYLLNPILNQFPSRCGLSTVSCDKLEALAVQNY